MLEVLDAAALRSWCALSLEALTAARQEIDDLNVYPVPDGDTGTNLQLTMASVQEALAAAPADLPATVKALVLGSLMGARGNSGVILSQLLRGLGEVFAGSERIGAAELAAALSASARSAYSAVAAPVEGTLLTVAREAAEGAKGTDLATVIRSAREAAAASLARTPDLLPQLKAAGVVDAGGRGWCLLLEALEHVVTGAAVPIAPSLLVPRDRSGLASARESGSEEFGFEVQYLLRDTDEAAVQQLKTRLGRLGDSLVVVGGDGLFNVHVHVNDIAAAIEAGIDAGRPFRLTVTRFADQASAGTTEAPRSGRAVVAVANGEGVSGLFRDAGAHVVDASNGRPSTQELYDSAMATGSLEVVLLPNDPNVRAVAAAAADHAKQAGLSVQVIPTASVLQGLAAISVCDPSRELPDDVLAMQDAALRTRWAEITTAKREAETEAGSCRAGDVLGLVQGRIIVVGQGVEAVAQQVLDHLLKEPTELVTVLLGAEADELLGERLVTHVESLRPDVEVLVLRGGQPLYPLLLGAE